MTARKLTLAFVMLAISALSGCNKGSESTENAAANAPAANAPAATPAAAAKPVAATAPAPSVPVPTFSAAQKLGMFVYPKGNQSHDQQLIDELSCYNSVEQQTGIDPEKAAPSAPTQAEI